MSDEIFITGGHVVTLDTALGDVPGGDVRVQDGVIAQIGTGLRPGPGAELVDARGRLVIPGLIDTHRHVWQGAIAGFTPQMTGYGYGPAVLTGISLQHSPADIYAGTLWGALQALDAGITTIGDWAHALQSAEHADANLRGLRESGIRGVFFYGGPGPAGSDPNPPHPVDARRMRDEQFPGNTDNGRLRMGMALRGPCFTSAERSRANAGSLARNELVHEVALHQRDMLRLATLGGAQVLGLADRTGSLTPGKEADVTVVDMRSPHLDGFGDPVAMLGLGAGPADVETVLVGGEFVKRDGTLVGTHAAGARDLMHEAQDRLRATVR